MPRVYTHIHTLRQRISQIALALLCVAAIRTDALNIRVTLGPNPDGVRTTAFTCVLADRSDCAPPTTGTLACDDSAAPSLSGQTVSTSYSEDVRQYFSGTAAAACTLSLATVSGSNAATTGWAISSPNLTISSATQGAGALKVGCTTGGNTVYCSNRNWSRNPASSDGGVAPTIPTGLAAAAGTNSVTFSGDCPSDPPPTASRLKQVNLRFNGTGATTAVTSCGAGLSRALTQQIIGSSDGTPSSSQTGTSLSLSFGGAGWDSTADQFLWLYDSTGIAGDAMASATYSSLSSSATFAKSTVMVRESTAAGSKFVACTLQKNGKLQLRYRATDSAASTLALNQAITLSAQSAFHLYRSGDSFTCEASDNSGTTWNLAGATINVPMASTLYWGAAITSNSAGTNATSALTNWNLNTNTRWSYQKSTASAISADVTAQDNDNNISAYSGSLSGTPTVVPQIRFKPGHYIHFGLSDTSSTVVSKIDGFCNDSSITGVAIFVYWNLIETSKGSYSWTYLDPILNKAAACGKYVIFRLQSRKFGTTTATNAVPSYLQTEGLTYSRTSPSAAAGAALWRQAAMDYFITVTKAVIDHINTTSAASYLVMVGGEESVLGLIQSGGANADYSATGQAAQEVRAMQAIRVYAPTLPYILFTNWFSYEDANKTAMKIFMAACIADKGCVLNGGPDALTNSSGSSGTSDGFGVWDGTYGGVDYRDQYVSLGQTEIDDWNRSSTPSVVFKRQQFEHFSDGYD